MVYLVLSVLPINPSNKPPTQMAVFWALLKWCRPGKGWCWRPKNTDNLPRPKTTRGGVLQNQLSHGHGSQLLVIVGWLPRKRTKSW